MSTAKIAALCFRFLSDSGAAIVDTFFFFGLKFIDCKATRAEGIQARKKETNAMPKTKASAGSDI